MKAAEPAKIAEPEQGMDRPSEGVKDRREAPSTSTSTSTSTSSGDSGSRKRKNRWDIGGESSPAPPAHPAAASLATSPPTVYSQPTPTASTPTAAPTQTAPLLSQATISAAIKLAKQPVVSDTYQPGMIRVGTKWMFPDLEDTDGGTYEHKKRMREMKETEEKAQSLTELAMKKGAHHISDYLPQTELAKFQTKAQAAKRGESAEPEEAQGFKLGEENKGFKLLKQAGWTEGKGLGAKESGIVAPISGTTMRPGNTGLGQEQVHEVTEDDDEFETYRKRMMLAYRYRPNPLNNPRRSYY